MGEKFHIALPWISRETMDASNPNPGQVPWLANSGRDFFSKL